MTESTMILAEYLRKIDVDLEGDFLREGVRLLAQLVMEGEISEQVGAAQYQRTPDRKTQRNGYRERPWDTREVSPLNQTLAVARDGVFRLRQNCCGKPPTGQAGSTCTA